MYQPHRHYNANPTRCLVDAVWDFLFTDYDNVDEHCGLGTRMFRFIGQKSVWDLFPKHSFVFMDALRNKITSSHINSSILLDSSKLLDNSFRKTSTYNDGSYFPFFYHLGNYTKPKKVVQIGPQMGLVAACFLQGCKVEEWLVVEPTKGIVEANIRQHNAGVTRFGDPEGDYDVGLLTEKHSRERTLECLNLLWDSLKWQGLLVVDYIIDDDVKWTFENFFRAKNRTPELFKTRYGIGILTR